MVKAFFSMILIVLISACVQQETKQIVTCFNQTLCYNSGEKLKFVTNQCVAIKPDTIDVKQLHPVAYRHLIHGENLLNLLAIYERAFSHSLMYDQTNLKCDSSKFKISYLGSFDRNDSLKSTFIVITDGYYQKNKSICMVNTIRGVILSLLELSSTDHDSEHFSKAFFIDNDIILIRTQTDESSYTALIPDQVRKEYNIHERTATSNVQFLKVQPNGTIQYYTIF